MEELTAKNLRKICGAMNLETSGAKVQLRARLRDNLTREPDLNEYLNDDDNDDIYEDDDDDDDDDIYEDDDDEDDEDCEYERFDGNNEGDDDDNGSSCTSQIETVEINPEEVNVLERVTNDELSCYFGTTEIITYLTNLHSTGAANNNYTDFIYVANSSPLLRHHALAVFPECKDLICAYDNREGFLAVDDYALEKILKYIRFNCDFYLNGNNEDLINFANLHPRIKHMAIYLFPCLGKEISNFQTDNVAVLADGSVEINFNYFYKKMRIWSPAKRETFWKLHLEKLASKAVKTFILRYTLKRYVPYHLDYFERTIDVLKDKPFIWSLEIVNIGYTVDTLYKFKTLEHLTICANLNAEDLVECCRANSNLEFLLLEGSTIYGNLADIVPYCKKLKKLTFTMKENAAEYAPLADLPRLQILHLMGQHHIGTLQRVFRALASSESQTLETLIVKGLMNPNEINELVRIKSLTDLTITIDDVPSLRALAQLTSLETLVICRADTENCSPIDAKGISDACLLLLEGCTILDNLMIYHDVEADFISRVVDVLKEVRHIEVQDPLMLDLYTEKNLTNEKKICNKMHKKYVFVELIKPKPPRRNKRRLSNCSMLFF